MSLLQHIEPATLITAEQRQKITKPSLVKDLLFKQSTFKRPQLFKANPLKDLWLRSQVSSGVLLNCCYSFLQKHKASQSRKGSPPFALSLYHLISSGNFPLQLVPGDYHLALKPWCTSAHRTNETPELGDGQIAKWYLSSMALWLCFALPPPLWVVWSVTEEPSEDWEGRELFLDKGRKLRTTQLY